MCNTSSDAPVFAVHLTTNSPRSSQAVVVSSAAGLKTDNISFKRGISEVVKKGL